MSAIVFKLCGTELSEIQQNSESQSHHINLQCQNSSKGGLNLMERKMYNKSDDINALPVS